ncbi:MAG: SMP-30/gluconolactonase/LRE family protein [Paracoccaceae bacterium]
MFDRPTILNPRCFFPEGPTLHRGGVLFVEYGAHCVTFWDGSANRRWWHRDGTGPSAIVRYGQGYVITCFDSGEMEAVSMEGATLAVHSRSVEGIALEGPNDCAPDGEGGVFFTCSGTNPPDRIDGRVFHLSAGGRVTHLSDQVQVANGLTLSGDGKLLLVNESIVGRISAFDVGPGPGLSRRRMWKTLAQDADFARDSNPDGLKFGPDGMVWVGLANEGAVVRLDLTGKLTRRVGIPGAEACPNFCFSADGETIFIAAVDDMSAPPWPGKLWAAPVG